MTDRRMETVVSTILRSGVIASGMVVLIGAVFYLGAHGWELTDYHNFHGQAAADRYVGRIVSGLLDWRPRSVMQFGILLLISTPIARVAFSLIGFALERDRVYVVITTVVLAVLLYSLISGAVGAG